MMLDMNDIDRLTELITEFRDEREWKQFHNLKDMAISLVLESNELLEHFQWKQNHELEALSVEEKREIGEELSDVLYWVLLMAHDLGLDITEAIGKKMVKNRAKYPVGLARGSKAKYTELKKKARDES